MNKKPEKDEKKEDDDMDWKTREKARKVVWVPKCNNQLLMQVTWFCVTYVTINFGALLFGGFFFKKKSLLQTLLNLFKMAPRKSVSKPLFHLWTVLTIFLAKSSAQSRSSRAG